MNPEPADSSHRQPAPQLQALRVLIADDEHDSLLTLGLLCRGEGMEIRLVRRGAEVPKAVAEFGPDVVLLDLAMPDRGGMDLAEELTDTYGDRCPVLIAVTAFATETDREMAKESGFHDFIAKPYDPQTLLRRLAALKPSGG